MRLLKLVGILSFVIVLSTGCYRNENKEDNPINLFDELPTYDLERMEISKEVNVILGSAALTLPSNSTEVGKINEVDLNGDGKKEIIFFEKREDIKNEVGFTILDSENDESYDTSHIESGNSIEYANFYDLDNDGNKEIILLIKNDYMTTITICRYQNGKINDLVSKNNFNKFNRNGFTKLGVLVDDINNDDNLELIVYNYNYKTKSVKVNVCNLKEDKISILDSLTFEDVKNFNDINISVGKISSKKKALFMSLPYTEKNGYITEVVYLEDEKLINAFKNHHEKILNEYYIPFEDVNNDGITNIPVIDSNNITVDTLSTNTSPTSVIVSWNKYNGKEGKEADLLFVSQIYYNYECKFKFLIPNNLVGKIYISENTEDTNNNYKIFDFYYYSTSEFYIDSSEQERKLLFSLNLTEKNIVDDTNNVNNKSNIKVLESDKYIFSISDTNEKDFKKFDLNVDILKDYFSIIK